MIIQNGDDSTTSNQDQVRITQKMVMLIHKIY